MRLPTIGCCSPASSHVEDMCSNVLGISASPLPSLVPRVRVSATTLWSWLQGFVVPPPNPRFLSKFAKICNEMSSKRLGGECRLAMGAPAMETPGIRPHQERCFRTSWIVWSPLRAFTSRFLPPPPRLPSLPNLASTKVFQTCSVGQER